MKPVDLAIAASRGVGRHPLRATLNILGVLIGVASTVVVVGVARGASRAATAQIAGLGPDLVVVYPAGSSASGVQLGFGSGSSLTEDDITALSDVGHVPDAVQAVPTTGLSTTVTSLSRTWRTDVVGSTDGFSAARGYDLAEGRSLDGAEVQGGASVAVVGQTVVDNLFAGVDPVGQVIRIETHPFHVVGVFRPRGYSGTFNQDDLVIVPITAARTYLLPATAPRIQQILVQATSAAATASVRDEITSTLLVRHHITDPAKADFQVRTQQDLVAGADRVGHVLRWMLVVVAAVALLTGTLGIATMMLASVTERAYEIGIRRAVGAKRSEILMQFLAEALLLAVVGGVIGIAIGVSAALLLGNLADDLPTPVISITAILAASGAALGAGLAAGVYPAVRAARLEPADAVRR